MEEYHTYRVKSLRIYILFAILIQSALLIWLALHYAGSSTPSSMNFLVFEDVLTHINIYQYTVLPLWLFMITCDVLLMISAIKYTNVMLVPLIIVTITTQLLSLGFGLILSFSSDNPQARTISLYFTFIFNIATCLLSGLLLKNAFHLRRIKKVRNVMQFISSCPLYDGTKAPYFHSENNSINSLITKSPQLLGGRSDDRLRNIKINRLHQLYSKASPQQNLSKT